MRGKKSAQNGTISFKMCMCKIEQIHKVLSATSPGDCYFMSCMPFHCRAQHVPFTCLNHTLTANSFLYIIWTLGMYELSGFSSHSTIQNWKVRYQWAENPLHLSNLFSDIMALKTDHFQSKCEQPSNNLCWIC